MKRRTEKPLEGGMRFFTPQLYARFNSANETVADRANVQWEKALSRYRLHLERLRGRLPDGTERLTELCLHDADLLKISEEIGPILLPPVPERVSPSWPAHAVLSMRHGEQVTILVYGLWDRLRETSPPVDWPFSPRRVHWLYDELDAASGDSLRLLHRILLSDGRVVEVPFFNALVHQAPVEQAARRRA